MTITLATMGWAYLLHFGRPLGNLENTRGQAAHYIGWAEDLEGDGLGLERRIAQHLAGQGACITRAAVAQGIEIVLVARWRAPLGFEKVLKRRKEAPKLCPQCCRARRQRPKRAAVPAIQLALPLDDAADDEELPAIEIGGWDWLEGEILKNYRATRGAMLARSLPENWDEGLL